MPRLSHLLLAPLLLGLGLAAAARDLAPAPEPATGYQAKQALTSTGPMVVAAHPLAVQAGLWALEQGGTALDAAIAAQLVLNLVEPQSSGIGGGAFLLHYDAVQRRLLSYDGRETAPAQATPGMFLRPDGAPMTFFEAVVGGRSVGVPGLLRMLEFAHAEHGELPWARLFEPAIALAEDGFAVSPRLRQMLLADRYLPNQPAARAYFYRADGMPRATLRNPALAALLRRVARDGADAFYQGPIAADIAAAVRAQPGGVLSAADLAGYRALRREPVCGGYRSFRVCGAPPPTSGGITTLQTLGILENFRVDALVPNSLQAVHLVSEAERLAYADRDYYLADPDFEPVPTAALLAPGYLQRRARLIDASHAMGRAQPGLPEGVARLPARDHSPELPSTSHLSIVDRTGNAVAMTSSIENAFGSRILVHGFLLNNEMTDFSFVPEQDGRPVANRVEPGKRPRSSMAPTMAFARDGELRIVIGSPGGASIIPYVVKTLLGVIDWELDIQQAVSLPNFGNRNGPTLLEAGTPLQALASPLRERGHEVRVTELNSGLHGITRAPGHWVGGADPRREGVAASLPAPARAANE